MWEEVGGGVQFIYYSSLFAGLWIDRRWLALTVSLSQMGICPSGTGQTRGVSPNHTSLFSQMRNSPQHTGPQTALLISLTMVLTPAAWRLNGGWLLLDPLPKTKAQPPGRQETPLYFYFPSELSVFCVHVFIIEHIPFRSAQNSRNLRLKYPFV